MKPPIGGPNTGPISAGTDNQAMASTNSLFFVAAHQHQPGNWRHHRAAHALKKARANKGAKRAGRGAGDGAQNEHANCGAKDILCAKPVGHPARHRDKDCQRDEVGRQRQFQRDRAGADVCRNCRQ
jgi:hypothetical protein